MNSLKRLFSQGLAVLLAAAALLGLISLLITPDVQSQVTRTEPLPFVFSDLSGSNQFGVSVAGIPSIVKSGVLYSMATTNIQYLHGTAATNTLVFINGLLYQRQ